MLQSNQVLSFFRPRENGGDWSQRELAEFYRVENALLQSGVSICTDRGLSDEGDPWFVFCRQDNDEVIVHFARIDGEYIVVSNLTEGVVRGRNFNALIRELVESHPYVLPKANPRRQTVYLHPATLLAALVVTGYIKSAELNSGPEDASPANEKGWGWIFNRHDLVAYTAIAIAAVWDALSTDSDFRKLAELASFDDTAAKAEANASTLTHGEGGFVLNDAAIHGQQVHTLDASHMAAIARGLELQATDVSTSDSWAAMLTAQVKALANQAVAPHANERELSAASHDGARGEDAGVAKSFTSHSDGDQVELVDNGQSSKVVVTATVKHETAAAAETASASPAETHGSSGNTYPVAQAAASADSGSALIALSNALHVDSQGLHPVVLAANDLSTAVNETLLQLNGASAPAGVGTALSPSANGVAAAGDTVVSSDLISSSAMHSFDAAAQKALDAFISGTSDYKIEAYGRDLLIVDTNLSHYASNQFGLETWVMPDGSTLSILGQAVHHPAMLAA